MRSPFRRGAGRAAFARRERIDDAARLTTRRPTNPVEDFRVATARLLRSAVALETPPPRHLEVLRVALELMSERGYSGASLRELARRLGVQQPSLYHYFDSKEQLAEQIVLHLGAEFMASIPQVPPPTKLEELPRFAVEGVLAIWEQPLYASFVRFLFAIAIEQPRFRQAIHVIYARGFESLSAVLLAPFVAHGEIDFDTGRALLRTAVNSVGLLAIEERLLYGKSRLSPELRAHAEATEKLLRAALSKRPRR